MSSESCERDRIKIAHLLIEGAFPLGETVRIKGWIRTLRSQKSFTFIEVNDGSCLRNIQVISIVSPPEGCSTGASVDVIGELVASPGKGQSVEIQAQKLHLIGSSPSDYPLQKKRHSNEFLRTIAHLRPRTNAMGAIARIRNTLTMAIHQFFQERDFLLLHSPILTTSDCEGAGEMFQVTTLPLQNPPVSPEGDVDFSQDFFGQPTYLTVSGQLNAEAYASALSSVYTFGPTFRAEDSHTSRHLAEFWMVEPEVAFANLHDIMQLAEHFLQSVLSSLLKKRGEDLLLFDAFISKGIISRLQKVIETPFYRMTYSEGIERLLRSGTSFEYPVQWGMNLQAEHERYLCEQEIGAPILLYHYPKGIKPFYMRLNEDDTTVAAVDLLVPGVGELMGGSQREERLAQLDLRMEECGVKGRGYNWYRD